MFNALKYTEEMEGAGFTRQQAETTVKILIEVMDQNFATKADLLVLKSDLQSEIKDLRHEMDTRFRAVDARFDKMDTRFQEMEYKLTIKLGTMITVAIGVTATLVKLL